MHLRVEEHAVVEEVFVLKYRLVAVVAKKQPRGWYGCTSFVFPSCDTVVAEVSDHPSTPAPSSQSSDVPIRLKPATSVHDPLVRS
tara:strand:- start:220 stop:474 length:255 start_codon:yes stop_codon:yes gene_type:complete